MKFFYSDLIIIFTVFFFFFLIKATNFGGEAAAQSWSSCKEIPHVQGQRSPSKTVGEVKSYLESNPIPTRNAPRVQTNLVHTRSQRPHRD